MVPWDKFEIRPQGTKWNLLLKQSRQHGVMLPGCPNQILLVAGVGAADVGCGIVLPEDEVGMCVGEGIEVNVGDDVIATTALALPEVVDDVVLAILHAAFIREPCAGEGMIHRFPGAGYREMHAAGGIVLPEDEVCVGVRERLKVVGPAAIRGADLGGLAGSEVPFALGHAGLVGKPTSEIVGLR